MILSSDTPNSVRPIGSTIVLTCTVYVDILVLSLAMNDSVTVKTVMSGPGGFMFTNTSQPIGRSAGGSITFTNTAMISSFGQTQSGNYSCTATLHSLTNAYNNTNNVTVDYTRVTTGEIFYFSEKLSTLIIYRCLSSTKRSFCCK